MRKICSLILLIWVVITWQSLAHEIEVIGKVTDVSTKETLPGVGITIKETTKGVVVDDNCNPFKFCTIESSMVTNCKHF